MSTPCIGSDPFCPCQDGMACHYRDAADGTKGWPVPPLLAPTDEQIMDEWKLAAVRATGTTRDMVLAFARAVLATAQGHK